MITMSLIFILIHNLHSYFLSFSLIHACFISPSLKSRKKRDNFTKNEINEVWFMLHFFNSSLFCWCSSVVHSFKSRCLLVHWWYEYINQIKCDIELSPWTLTPLSILAAILTICSSIHCLSIISILHPLSLNSLPHFIPYLEKEHLSYRS